MAEEAVPATPTPSSAAASAVATAGVDSAQRWFRLRGEVGGAVRTFLLPPGESHLGSLPDNEVALPVRGVSRRHAVLTVGPDGVQVRDRGSKNGVRVAGRRVETATLGAGDEVRFGPLTFRVEELAPGDARLAIVLPAGDGSRPGHTPATPTPFLSTRGPADAGRWLDLVERVAEDLGSGPRPDVGAAVARLGRAVGAAGVCLARLGADGEAVVLAAWGRVGGPPASAHRPPPGHLRTDRRDGTRPGTVPAVTLSLGTAARSQESGPNAGGALVLDLRRPETPAPGGALRTVLRLLAVALAPGEGGVRSADAAPRSSPRAAEREERLSFPPGHVLCPSPAMEALYRQMASISGTELPVLLGGETGVGKELLARTVHLSSPRAGGPFVAVNCAAIPAELLEAEMFGIGRRVATGVEARPGRFRQAHGGTLFLDEIGDLPLPLQAKLLRALESKEIHPVGSAPQAVDVRLVAASNADLRRAAADGRFREDLYYRLAGCVLEVPPLRRRREDLPVLVERFVAAAAEEAGKQVRGVSWSALECLSAYPWPGNVRELQHEMRRLVHLCPAGGVVDSTLLPSRLVAGAAAPAADDDGRGGADAAASLRLEDHVVPLERRLVREALRRAGGNRSEAARLLGMSRNGLAYKLKTLGLDG